MCLEYCQIGVITKGSTLDQDLLGRLSPELDVRSKWAPSGLPRCGSRMSLIKARKTEPQGSSELECRELNIQWEDCIYVFIFRTCTLHAFKWWPLPLLASS